MVVRLARVVAAVLTLTLALPAVGRGAAPRPPEPNTFPSSGDMAEARKLFGEGDVSFANGQYDAAIAAYRDAFELSGVSNCLYNIALAYDKQEDFEAALEYLDHYRSVETGPPSDELLSKTREIETRAEQARLEAEARAREAEADEEPEPEPEPEPAPDDTSPPSGALVPAAIASAAVAIVGLGTGAALGIVSERNKVAAASVCGLDGDGTRYCSAQADEALGASRRYAIAADVVIAVGAVAAVTTVVLLAVRAVRNKRSRSTFVAGRHGASLRLRF